MNRINVVPPSELSNKHLLAEYRELPRIMRLARAAQDIPPAYTLGQGHVKFFYNKLSYIAERFAALVAECKRRGFAIQHHELRITKPLSVDLFGRYTPTEEALQINRARIAERTRPMKKKEVK